MRAEVQACLALFDRTWDEDERLSLLDEALRLELKAQSLGQGSDLFPDALSPATSAPLNAGTLAWNAMTEDDRDCFLQG